MIDGLASGITLAGNGLTVGDIGMGLLLSYLGGFIAGAGGLVVLCGLVQVMRRR